MRLPKITNPHIPISIICYVACLFFSGFYFGENYEPWSSAVLLADGWLGVLGGYFYWFANPLFFLALLFAWRPGLSSAFGIIGLTWALAFLLEKKIPINEAGSYAPIVAYGWGYGLWVTALAVLSIGQLIRALSSESNLITPVSILSCVSFLAIYLAYYSIGDNSLLAIKIARNSEFKELCSLAGEHIYKKADGGRGVFLDPDWTLRISSPPTLSPKVYLNGGSIFGGTLLSSGYVAFYETRGFGNQGGYIKYGAGDPKGQKSNSLDSGYEVVTMNYKIPPRFNILGANVVVRDRRDKTILATSTYFFENGGRTGGRFCGNFRNMLTREFVENVFIRKEDTPVK